MTIVEQLNELRSYGGERSCVGLSDEVIASFAETDERLGEAVSQALSTHRAMRENDDDLLKMDEADQVHHVQQGLINFYAGDAINPYVAIAAAGPWLITSKGAVIHDSGGYGMLGFGHAPESIINTMSQPHVMANVMTPSFSHKRIIDALKREIGHTRGKAVFADFLCLNSGSESVSVAARMSDINAKLMTDPGGRHEGKRIRQLSLKGGFHGRTDRPAQYSDSSIGNYTKHLASFRDRDGLLTVEPNNVEDLKRIFATVEQNGEFIESFFMEPVMGEGNPGEAITVEFYEAARALTRAHGSLLLVDSIQAGLRAQGCLSIVDYPGFGEVDAPDMETYSKALNGGQYPLSVLALNDETATLYRKGIYGNTMTTNPRAMDIAVTVLENIDDELRANIRDRGAEFVDKLKALADRMDGRITKVQGTGLLFSCEVSSHYKAYGAGSLEEYLRLNGIGVIHGGENSLRFTPPFHVTSAEVDLIVNAVEDALINGPVRSEQDQELAVAG